MGYGLIDIIAGSRFQPLPILSVARGSENMEPVRLPIDGILDLHTFQPTEVNDLLEDYLEACLEEGIYSLQIITGKGKGIMKRRVESALKRHPHVSYFRDAEPSAGGWGAIWVGLKEK
jgi:DNA-nicking Smr family endonuclease